MKKVLALVMSAVLILSACDSKTNKLTKRVFDYTPEESVFFCSGIQTWAYYVNMQLEERGVPSSVVINQAVNKIGEAIEVDESKIEAFVVKGYEYVSNCVITDTEECRFVTEYCKLVSEDFYAPLVKK